MSDIEYLKHSIKEWKREIFYPSNNVLYTRKRLDTIKEIILSRLSILDALNDYQQDFKKARNSMEDSIYVIYDLLFGEETPFSSFDECQRILNANMNNMWKQYKEIKRINSGYTSSTLIGASINPHCDDEDESFEEEI